MNFQNKISLDYLKEELQKISGDADIIQDNQRVNIPERSKDENIKKQRIIFTHNMKLMGLKENHKKF
jgi:hypothetical protein